MDASFPTAFPVSRSRRAIYPHSHRRGPQPGAEARPAHMGRPSKLTDAQKAEARRRRAEGATLAELARSYHVGKSTISRLAGQGS